MALPFPVSEAKRAALERRMTELGVREAEFEESFMRSAGAGGQHVNKTSTCVVLEHRPSGLRVRCQQERSQALNRYLARVWLLDRIEAVQKGEASRIEQEREKIRRQKRRRSRRSKQQSVESKRRLGQKKALRRPPTSD